MKTLLSLAIALLLMPLWATSQSKKTTPYQVHLNKAYKYLYEGEYSKSKADAAIQEYTQAIALEPKNYEAYYYRAYCRRTNRGLYEDALRDINIAIDLRSNYFELYRERAEIYEDIASRKRIDECGIYPPNPTCKSGEIEFREALKNMAIASG